MVALHSRRATENEKLSPEELVKWMKTQGVSPKELSEIFGVSTQAVNLWINGEREFSVTNSRIVRLFIKHPTLIREF